MCVIVDANCFSSVFSASAKNHQQFLPVYEWLMYGKGGRLIYGGEKYKREIDVTKEHYRKMLVEIQRKGRLVHLDDSEVDRLAAEVRTKVNNDEFDDEHIVAIVGISKCCVVCSLDKRSYPFLKRRDLYPNGVRPPKIYRSARNHKLCGCDRHIVAICR